MFAPSLRHKNVVVLGTHNVSELVCSNVSPFTWESDLIKEREARKAIDAVRQDTVEIQEPNGSVMLEKNVTR